jgi:hypothetical protein
LSFAGAFFAAVLALAGAFAFALAFAGAFFAGASASAAGAAFAAAAF